MLFGFAVTFSASVVTPVLRTNAPLSLGCYHCITTVNLLHSDALRIVQSDMYIAPVTATNDVNHNPPQPQNGSDYKDEKMLKWRSHLLLTEDSGIKPIRD
jgi:hypothetical protein